MPLLFSNGLMGVDLRLLTFTLDNSPVTLHYFVRRDHQKQGSNNSDESPHSTSLEPSLWFILREIDIKILRSSSTTTLFDHHSGPIQASNEHTERDHRIRTTINEVCKREHIFSTPSELRLLKALKQVHIRAPSVALISPSTIIKILRHFHFDIKAVVFEAVLIQLHAETRLLKSLLLTMKSAVFASNQKFNQPNDNDHTFEMLKEASAAYNLPYPSPWSHYFGEKAPLLDCFHALALQSTLEHHCATTSWTSLIDEKRQHVATGLQQSYFHQGPQITPFIKQTDGGPREGKSAEPSDPIEVELEQLLAQLRLETTLVEDKEGKKTHIELTYPLDCNTSSSSTNALFPTRLNLENNNDFDLAEATSTLHITTSIDPTCAEPTTSSYIISPTDKLLNLPPPSFPQNLTNQPSLIISHQTLATPLLAFRFAPAYKIDITPSSFHFNVPQYLLKTQEKHIKEYNAKFRREQPMLLPQWPQPTPSALMDDSMDQHDGSQSDGALVSSNSDENRPFSVYDLNLMTHHHLINLFFMKPVQTPDLMKLSWEWYVVPPQNKNCQSCMQRYKSYLSQLPQASESFEGGEKEVNVEELHSEYQSFIPCLCRLAREGERYLSSYIELGDPTITARPSSNAAPAFKTNHIGDPAMLSFPSIVFFSTILTLAYIYYQNRISAAVTKYQQAATRGATSTLNHVIDQIDLIQFPTLSPPEQQALLLTSSFKWLIKHLKYPIVYSSILVEFNDIDINQSLYADSNKLVPPLYLIADKPVAPPTSGSNGKPQGDQTDDKMYQSLVDILVQELSEDHCVTSINNVHLETSIPETAGEQAETELLAQMSPGTRRTRLTTSTALQSAPRAEKHIITNTATKRGAIPDYDNLKDLEFPYNIAQDDLHLYRSFLYHLEILPPLFKLRLFRHANCVYQLSENDQIVQNGSPNGPRVVLNIDELHLQHQRNSHGSRATTAKQHSNRSNYSTSDSGDSIPRTDSTSSVFDAPIDPSPKVSNTRLAPAKKGKPRAAKLSTSSDTPTPPLPSTTLNNRSTRYSKRASAVKLEETEDDERNQKAKAKKRHLNLAAAAQIELIPNLLTLQQQHHLQQFVQLQSPAHNTPTASPRPFSPLSSPTPTHDYAVSLQEQSPASTSFFDNSLLMFGEPDFCFPTFPHTNHYSQYSQPLHAEPTSCSENAESPLTFNPLGTASRNQSPVYFPYMSQSNRPVVLMHSETPPPPLNDDFPQHMTNTLLETTIPTYFNPSHRYDHFFTNNPFFLDDDP